MFKKVISFFMVLPFVFSTIFGGTVISNDGNNTLTSGSTTTQTESASVLEIIQLTTNNNSPSNILEIESLIPSHEAEEYAQKMAGIMLADAIIDPEIFGVIINDSDNVVLGTPYTIFSEDDNNEEIYYYPLLEDNYVKFILSVFKTDDGWGASFGEDIAKQLNSLETIASKDNPYILYSNGGKIYAQNNKNTILIEEKE